MREGPKRLRVVCDTNVLLSMLGLPGRRLEALWEILLEGHVELFLSEFILEELSRNLKRKLGLPEEAVQGILRVLKRHAEIVSPPREFLDRYFPLR